jgi:SAM-dependent methyltransferase
VTLSNSFCRVCRNATGQTIAVREMMFGLDDKFTYFECSRCGCLTLQNPPSPLERFYPAGKYYSLGEATAPLNRPKGFRGWVKRCRDQAECFGSGGLFGWLAQRRSNQDAAMVRPWIIRSGLRSRHSPILDVGCGHGWHLRLLDGLGFTNLTGIDPFLPSDVHQGNVRIKAGSFDVVDGQTFDLIMLHHSLEHMPDQVAALTSVKRLLSPAGCCLIRIPVASNGPWKRYREHWAEIDAPRHFVLHTKASLGIAAAEVGLKIRETLEESDLFAYMASELYRKGMTLFDHDRGMSRDLKSCFSSDELSKLESMRAEDEASGAAGRAAFFLFHDRG